MRRLLAFSTALLLSGLFCLHVWAQGMSIPLLGAGGKFRIGGVATTTFNPSKKSTHITLSGGNLVATSDVVSPLGTDVFSVAAHATGKYYAEFTLTTNSTDSGVGIANASFMPDNGVVIGGDTNSLGYYADGNVYGNGGGTQTTLLTYTTADVIGMAVDFSSSLIWWRKNNGNWNNSGAANPATGTGGLNYSAYLSGTFNAGVEMLAASGVWAANFGATAYTNAAPAGYGNW